jgi:hypothetical protein
MRLVPIFLLGAVFSFGCGGRDVIPNTDVEDSSANRDVITFCEGYRHAVERRDVPRLLGFASDRYFDDNGTPGAQDDLDRERLRERLSRWAQALLDVRYEIRYRRVTHHSDRIFVDYTYTASFKLATQDGAGRWSRRLADNRIVLAREGDAFKILSGM